MIRICAWCEEEGQRDNQPQRSEGPSEPVSHGMCQTHVRRLRHGYRRSFAHQNPTTSHHHSSTASTHS